MKKWKERLCVAAMLLVGLFLVACTSKFAKAVEKVELGQKYLTELNYTEAVASFTEAIKLDPDNIQAYMGRAEAYLALGEYDKALTDYQFVSKKTEDLPYTRALSYIGQAEVYEQTGQPDQAVSAYGQAKALLNVGDAGKAENISEEDVDAKLVQVLYVHAALCETLKNYNAALEDYDALQKLGENVGAKQDEVLSQLGDAAENENDLPGTKEPAAEDAVEEPEEEPASTSAPEQEAASESESQKPQEETKQEEPTASSEQPKEEAASGTAVQEKQTYTAKDTTSWSYDSSSGTTTESDKVTYQIGGNTITVKHTIASTWTNYDEPGVQHTDGAITTYTYTLSQPLQGMERQGQWAVIWDVPAGTVVSSSYTHTVTKDGEIDDGQTWESNLITLFWAETSRILTSDEVDEQGAFFGESLTVEKGKMYEIGGWDEGGFVIRAGGFVFRGI